MYRISGIGDHDSVWQMRQFLSPCGVRRMAGRRRERFLDRLIDSNKYGIVLKVKASNMCFYGSSYYLSLFNFFVVLCLFIVF